MKNKLVILSFLVSLNLFSQFDRGSVDFGIGGIVSIGLQEELGFDIRFQYTTASKISSYTVEYNRFYGKEFETTQEYNEFAATYNLRLFYKEVITLTAGAGYVINDYEVLNIQEDTSKLFFETGRINHAALLKLSGFYHINTQIDVFAELNFKTFGKRYDTFIVGLKYSLGI